MKLEEKQRRKAKNKLRYEPALFLNSLFLYLKFVLTFCEFTGTRAPGDAVPAGKAEEQPRAEISRGFRCAVSLSDSRLGEEPCFRLEMPPVLRKYRLTSLSHDSVLRLRPAMQSAGRCLPDVSLSTVKSGRSGDAQTGYVF